jgi:hypothetical protein
MSKEALLCKVWRSLSVFYLANEVGRLCATILTLANLLFVSLLGKAVPGFLSFWQSQM